MIDDILIIDAAVHGLQNSPEIANSNPYIKSIVDLSYWVQSWVPQEYRVDAERFFGPHSSEELFSAIFYESQTDIATYHALPMKGLAKDYCPISIGLEMRERCPHRMLIYAPPHPLDGVEKTIEELERNVEEVGINGIKLYPMDLIDGKMRSWSLADEQLLYPVYERCLQLGVKVIAVHKAVPLGITPMDPFRVGDVDYAARDFPDLKFEVVHSGLAFLDESAWQVSRYDNVYVNMVCPTRLLHIVEHLLKAALVYPIDDSTEHLQEASVGVKRKTPVPCVHGEPFDSLVVQAKVEDRVHHSWHRYGRARANRHEQRVPRITEALAGLLLEPPNVLRNLKFETLGQVACAHVRPASVSRDGESGGHGQPHQGHLSESNPLPAEQLSPPIAGFIEVVDVSHRYARDAATSTTGGGFCSIAFV